MDNDKPTLGFIGLGNMGEPMARRLLQAGYSVIGYDVAPPRMAACEEKGIKVGEDAADVVRRTDCVLTSLPYSHIFVQVAEAELIPHARAGQLFINLGTVAPTETRRLASAFAAKGATLLDVPVSGGAQGASTGTLRMFVGGDRATAERCWPLLEVLGDPERIVYCGPSGAGQVVKGVNQLTSGLTSAVCLETIAFGLNQGVPAEALDKAIGGETGWRGQFRRVLQQVTDDQGESVGVKFGQLNHYLKAASQNGMKMPLTEALYEFCRGGDIVTVEANRPSPSFWRELCLARNKEK